MTKKPLFRIKIAFAISFMLLWIASCDRTANLKSFPQSKDIKDFGIVDGPEFSVYLKLLLDLDGVMYFELENVNATELDSILNSFKNRSNIVNGKGVRSLTIDCINAALATIKSTRIYEKQVLDGGAFSWSNSIGEDFRCHFIYLTSKKLYLEIVTPNVDRGDEDLPSDWSDISGR